MLSRAEVATIRAKVAPPPETDLEARRRELKKLSDERVKHWPNTLEATRMKKQNWKLEKEQRLEEERLQIDRREAELQRQMRLETIAKANAALYEQTDKIKSLRSALLYGDILETRAAQVQEAQARRARSSVRDAAYLEQALRGARAVEEREEREARARKAASATLAAVQMEQLSECRDKYVASLVAERAEGARVAAEAAAAAVREREEGAAARRRARAEMEKMMAVNTSLREQREAHAQKEQEELQRCEEERGALNALAAARKALEGLRFQERQAVRQAMIDRATAELLKRSADIDNREEREAKEQRAREDAEAERRRDMRTCEHAAIEESRAQARAARAAAAADARLEGERIKAYYRQCAEEAAHQEEAEAAEALRRNLAVKASQVEQRREARERKALEDERQAAQHARLAAVAEEEKRRFAAAAQVHADELQAHGRSTYMLRRALEDAKMALPAADAVAAPSGA
ncbi:hypothetical protein JKP88DRAFT_245526 [Tribonema minus]|uniref:Trichohyalin-plectin-homology domain-containing protein n=1 Tax=Tribonema minus TaxID=303371 RepID=A0A835YVV5_9STRA|nr:hypothetical protein JKP88DRAFT_245526 [Tribonema minus]